MTERNCARLVITCPDCAVHEEVDSPNDGVAFYRRHRSVTGHDLEWEPPDHDDYRVVPSDGIVSVIGALEQLEQRLGDSVPIGAVTVALGERGATIGETLEEIRELRMEGMLYEPRDDHLLVT